MGTERDSLSESVRLGTANLATRRRHEPPYFALLAAGYRRRACTHLALQALAVQVLAFPRHEAGLEGLSGGRRLSEMRQPQRSFPRPSDTRLGRRVVRRAASRKNGQEKQAGDNAGCPAHDATDDDQDKQQCGSQRQRYVHGSVVVKSLAARRCSPDYQVLREQRGRGRHGRS